MDAEQRMVDRFPYHQIRLKIYFRATPGTRISYRLSDCCRVLRATLLFIFFFLFVWRSIFSDSSVEELVSLLVVGGCLK